MKMLSHHSLYLCASFMKLLNERKFDFYCFKTDLTIEISRILIN